MTDQEFAAAIPRKIEEPSSDHMGTNVTAVHVDGKKVGMAFSYDVDAYVVFEPVYGEVAVTFVNPDTKTEFRLDRHGVVKAIAPNVYESIDTDKRKANHREIVKSVNSLSTLVSRMAESAQDLNDALQRMAKNGGAK